MRNISVIFRKQLADTMKNKTILIQFIMFPIMVLVMENAVKIDDIPEHFFVKLLSVMFVGMAPLVCMSSIIAEEKEKNTLRVLMMTNVRSSEYLVGVGAYVFVMCSVGTMVFAAAGGYGGGELAEFIAVMSVGIILSELTGAVIGVFSRNQMTATSISVPVMMIFSFLPMLSMFNNTIRSVARVTWSQQISNIISGIGSTGIRAENVIVILLDLAAALALFIASYKKKGLE